MMKRFSAFIALLVVFFAVNAFGEESDAVLGIWYNEEKTSGIEIFRCTDCLLRQDCMAEESFECRGKRKGGFKKP